MTAVRAAVVGGTGTLGAALVAELSKRGDEVRVLSRNPPRAPLPEGASHHRADLLSGEGLAPALAGVDAVFDAANGTGRNGAVLLEGTKRLLEAEAAAGVGHHLEISIVGCDRVPYSYYRTKVAQEEIVAAGAVPWSLLRATQFHQLLDGMFGGLAKLRLRGTGEAQMPLRIPSIGRFARSLRDGGLCVPDAAAGGRSFAEWLAAGRPGPAL